MKKEDTYVGQRVAFYSPEEGYVVGVIISLENVDQELQEQLSNIDFSSRVIIKPFKGEEILVKKCRNIIGLLPS